MRGPRASQKGMFLVQVVVLLALLGIIAAMASRLLFQRKVQDNNAIYAEFTRQRALGLQNQAMDCLNNNNPTYGTGGSCDFGAAAACISAVSANIQAGGTPPNCTIQVVLP